MEETPNAVSESLETRIKNVREFLPSNSIYTKRLIELFDDLRRMPMSKYLENYPDALDEFKRAGRKAGSLTRQTVKSASYYDAVRLVRDLKFIRRDFGSSYRKEAAELLRCVLFAMAEPILARSPRKDQNPPSFMALITDRSCLPDEEKNIEAVTGEKRSLSELIGDSRDQSQLCLKLFDIPLPHYFWSAAVRSHNFYIWSVYENEIRQLMRKNDPEDNYTPACIAKYCYDTYEEALCSETEEQTDIFSILTDLAVLPFC